MGFLGDRRSPPRLVGVLGSAPCLLPASVQLVAIGFGQPSLEPADRHPSGAYAIPLCDERGQIDGVDQRERAKLARVDSEVLTLLRSIAG